MPDNAVLIETTVLVHYLRQSPAAADYLDTARAQGSLICSAVTQAELIVGSRTRAELRAIDQLLARSTSNPLTATIRCVP
jgi:predicted nucleic acid-binding protein